MIKQLALSIAVLALSACGFRPVHQTGIGTASFPDLQIVSTDGQSQDDKRAGYEIRQALITRMGEGSGATRLELDPRLFQTRLGLTANDVASRVDLRLQTVYSIVDGPSGDVLDSGRINSSASFDAQDDPFARIRAEDAAIDRLAKETADDLLIAISKFYSKK